jgi:hypothetical protein
MWKQRLFLLGMLAAIIATGTVVFLQREIGRHALITLLGPVVPTNN